MVKCGMKLLIHSRTPKLLNGNVHCVVTEKVPARYRSLKMADASLGKGSIFLYSGGIARTRQGLSVHRGTENAQKRFGIPSESRETPVRLYEAFLGPCLRER